MSRFGLLIDVSHQPSYQIDHEIPGAAMAGMLNLSNVLEWAIDLFNDGTFA